MFDSNDAGFRRVLGLPLVLLDEVIAAPKSSGVPGPRQRAAYTA
jgi:hypothetical protein